MGFHWKIPHLGGLGGWGFTKNNIEGGLPKKGGLDSLIYGGLGKKVGGGGVFEGWLIPWCTLHNVGSYHMGTIQLHTGIQHWAEMD